jgi:hypothetical protein
MLVTVMPGMRASRSRSGIDISSTLRRRWLRSTSRTYTVPKFLPCAKPLLIVATV